MQCSNLLFFLVLLPAAAVSQLPPQITLNHVFLPAGSGDTTIQVFGQNFTAASLGLWNGQPRTTQFVNDLLLKVTIPQSDLASPSLSYISVSGLSSGGPVSAGSPVLVYLPVANNDLLYDASRALLYVAVAKLDPNGPSLAIFDPAAGIIQRYIPFPSEPTTLALSGDSRYLYSGLQDRIRRMDLTGASPDLDIPFSTLNDLGGASFGSPATSILVLPAQPTSFVVALGESSFVVDGATPRPKFSNAGVRCLAGTPDGTHIYGGPGGLFFSGPGFAELTIDQTGFPMYGANVWIAGLAGGPNCPAYANGVLYGSNGDIVNAAAAMRIGAFGAYGMVHAVPQTKQTWFLNVEGTPASLNLRFMAFDNATGNRLQQVPLPIAMFPSNGRLVDWGTNGFAFGDYSNPYSSSAKWLYIMQIPQ